MKGKRQEEKSRINIGILLLWLLGILIPLAILIYFCTSTIEITFTTNEEETKRIVQAEPENSKSRTPTEEDLEELKVCYQELVDYISSKELTIDAISEMYSKEVSQITCSKTNKCFNQLDELFKEYKADLETIEEYFSAFEEKYEAYLDMLGNIPRYAIVGKQEKYEEFEATVEPMLEYISKQKEVYNSDEEEVTKLHEAAQKLADDYFWSIFDLASRLVEAEAGNCPAIEKCYVLNVAENRQEDPTFWYATDFYGIVYAENQYSPTWTGAINNTPSEATKQIVEEYLRGRIDTGMPADVVYQATFPQGSRKDDPWKIMDSGHYFCYR